MRKFGTRNMFGAFASGARRQWYWLASLHEFRSSGVDFSTDFSTSAFSSIFRISEMVAGDRSIFARAPRCGTHLPSATRGASLSSVEAIRQNCVLCFLFFMFWIFSYFRFSTLRKYVVSKMRKFGTQNMFGAFTSLHVWCSPAMVLAREPHEFRSSWVDFSTDFSTSAFSSFSAFSINFRITSFFPHFGNGDWRPAYIYSRVALRHSLAVWNSWGEPLQRWGYQAKFLRCVSFFPCFEFFRIFDFQHLPASQCGKSKMPKFGTRNMFGTFASGASPAMVLAREPAWVPELRGGLFDLLFHIRIFEFSRIFNNFPHLRLLFRIWEMVAKDRRIFARASRCGTHLPSTTRVFHFLCCVSFFPCFEFSRIFVFHTYGKS